MGFSYLIDFNGHQIGDAVKSVKSPSPLSWTAVGLHVCPGVLQRGGKEKRRLRRAELIVGADGGADIQNGSLCYMTCETWSSYIIRFLRQTSHKLRAGGRTRRHLADHLFLFCLPQTLRFPQFSLDDHVRVNRNISGERLWNRVCVCLTFLLPVLAAFTSSCQRVVLFFGILPGLPARRAAR